MSRAYNARRKTRRKQARTSSEQSGRDQRLLKPPRLTALLPVSAIAIILAMVGFAGFGGNSVPDRQKIRQEITALLAGVPQHGAALGSSKAPITIKIFGDLECPTVKRFAEVHLPSIINTWVRNGTVKLEYRSLKTDTEDEDTFFRQEIAALAAGRQARMWNFLLTFLREQGAEYSQYATENFLTDIASQIPGLEQARWRNDRKGIPLFNQVALGFHAAHQMSFSYTPSFVVNVNKKESRGESTEELKVEIEASLRQDIEELREEDFQDFPTLRTSGS